MASTYIDREECIGDSLVKLNSNFFGLDSDINTLNTRVTTVSSLVTTTSTSLSSNVQVGPYVAKAWVSFIGTGSVGANQTIHSQYNVSSVLKTADGIYTINYTTPLNSTINCIVGSCADNAGGFFVCANNSSSTQAFITTIRVSPLSVASSSYINVAVFGV